MATIPGLYRRGKVYWYNFQVNGHRSRISLHTDDLSAAVANARLIRTDPAGKTGDTILSLSDAFLASKVQSGRFSEATRRASQLSLKLFAQRNLKLPVHAITKHHVQAWFADLRADSSESTAQTHYFRIRSFFQWCRKELRNIDHNPTDGIKLGKITTRARLRFCTRQERDLLIRTVPKNRPDLKFVLFCGFYAGMRRNEISEARREWFDLANGLVHIQQSGTFLPKDGEDRTVPLALPFKKFLKTFLSKENFCLAGHKETRGRSLYRYDFRRPFSDHVKAQGLDWVTPHVMRKTFASLLVSSGVSIYKVALWLGDDVRTTQKHYARLLPESHDIARL